MRPCVDENEATGLLRDVVVEQDALVSCGEVRAECFDFVPLLARVRAPVRQSHEPAIRLGRGASLWQDARLELVGICRIDERLRRRHSLAPIVNRQGASAHLPTVEPAMPRLSQEAEGVGRGMAGSTQVGVAVVLERVGGDDNTTESHRRTVLALTRSGVGNAGVDVQLNLRTVEFQRHAKRGAR